MKSISIVATLLVLVLPLAAQNATAPQSWTASDGRVIQAKFIKLDGEAVVIEKDGKQFAVAFAKLNAASVEQAKKLGGIAPVVAADAKPSVATFDPAGTDPIKPLWVVAQKDLLDPAAADKKLSFDRPTALNSGNLIFPISPPFRDVSGQGAALVDGKTGKVMWRTYLTDSPPDTTEWGRGCIEGPDGHIILGSVTFHGKEKLEGALIHLRQLDRATGKVLTHMKMAVNDPDSSEEPKDVFWNGGQGDVDMAVRGQHIIFANEYFVAEIDMTQGKVLRSTKNKKEWIQMYASILPGAPCVFWSSDPQASMDKVFARPGEEARLVPAPKAGWSVVTAGPQRNESGLVSVVCQSPDKQSWAAGAYDPMKDKWAWVKTDAELATPVAGMSKSVTSISFDSRNDDTKGPKYEGQWFVDAATGDLRYHSPGYNKMKFLSDGRAWVIKENEYLLMSCSDGKVEARIPREAGSPDTWRMLFTPDGDVLSAAVKNGAVEITVMSAARKAAFPSRKIAVELPSPPKDVSLLQINPQSAVPVVLRITCTDKTEHFCAIPLPAK